MTAPAESPQQIMERALTSERGVRVKFATALDLKKFRNRCYKVAAKDRRKAEKFTGDAASDYDNLTYQITEENPTWLDIVPGSPNVHSVEDL